MLPYRCFEQGQMELLKVDDQHPPTSLKHPSLLTHQPSLTPSLYAADLVLALMQIMAW